MNSRTLRALFGAVLFAAGLFVVPAQEAAGPTVTILVPRSTSSIPLLRVGQLDAAENLFPDFTVEIRYFTNHPQALALLLRGEADLLFTGTSQGWQNHLDGGPLVLVNTGVWGVSSMVTRRDDIDEVEDLRGKTVAVPFPGSPLDVQLRYILRAAGIDPHRDLTIRFSAFPQTIGGISMGQIDAAPLPEPIATDLVQQRGFTRVFEMREAWGEAIDGDPFAPEVSLFAFEGRLSELRERVIAITAAWAEASSWVSANADEAALQFAETLERPVPVLREAIERTVYRVPSFTDNERLVREYFDVVRAEVTTIEGSLGAAFFFAP